MKIRYFLVFCFVPLLLHSAPLSLEQARELAISNNYVLQQNKEIVSASSDEQKAAFTRFLPSIHGEAAYTRLNKKPSLDLEDDVASLLEGIQAFSDQAGLSVNTDPLFASLVGMYQSGLLDNALHPEFGKENNYFFTVSCTQPLFTGGKIIEQYNISKSAHRIASAKQELTRQEVILKTDRYYWLVVALQEKVHLAQQYYQTVQKHVTDLENYFSEGIITENELLKAQVKKNDADLKLLKAKQGFSLARMSLNQHLGLPLENQTSLPDSIIIGSNNIQNQSEKIRPEIAMLTEHLYIEKSGVKIHRSRYFPNILFQGNYSWTNPNPFNGFNDEFGNDWSISLVVQMDFFHWNERGFSLSSAKHRKRAAELKLAETKELITLEIEQHRHAFAQAEKKIILTETSQKQATKNKEIAINKFHEGMISSSEVLDAQTLWQQAVSEFIEAKAEYQTEKTALQKACGQL